MPNQIVVEGLTQFRLAVRRAAVENPRLVMLGLKAAGVPIIAAAASSAPRRTGRLAGSFKVSVRGSRASIVSSVPYAPGAEWGRFGKWAGFPGTPPRFVVPAVENNLDAVALILERELQNVIRIYGWAT